MLPSFPLFVYLKKYDTFSEYFALVSQKKQTYEHLLCWLF